MQRRPNSLTAAGHDDDDDDQQQQLVAKYKDLGPFICVLGGRHLILHCLIVLSFSEVPCRTLPVRPPRGLRLTCRSA